MTTSVIKKIFIPKHAPSSSVFMYCKPSSYQVNKKIFKNDTEKMKNIYSNFLFNYLLKW